MDNKEIVETKYHPSKGNYIPGVYFVAEKGNAVVLRREDGKIAYIYKWVIKGGFHRNRKIPQDIRLVDYCTIPFYWRSPKKIYLD